MPPSRKFRRPSIMEEVRKSHVRTKNDELVLIMRNGFSCDNPPHSRNNSTTFLDLGDNPCALMKNDVVPLVQVRLKLLFLRKDD